MAIVYDKLMALNLPAAEQTYTTKDCILYALGVGFGHDPMNEDELPFVYEKDLKVLPTMGTVLGHPGFWARNRDTGIDWVKIVNGEQGITLYQPLKSEGTVVGKQKIIEVVDKGPGKGALILSERTITDKATGAPIATVTHTTFCTRRWGLRRSAARSTASASAADARTGRHLRSRHAAGSGAGLSLERRSQSPAFGTSHCQASRLSAADRPRPRHVRHLRSRGAEDFLRLRPEQAQIVRRAFLSPGISWRNHPH